MIAYTGAERALYAEALRTIAAVANARVENRTRDTLALQKTYLMVAEEMGVTGCTAWSILATAANVTIMGLVDHIATLEEVEQSDVTGRMIFAAVERVASDAL